MLCEQIENGFREGVLIGHSHDLISFFAVMWHLFYPISTEMRCGKKSPNLVGVERVRKLVKGKL